MAEIFGLDFGTTNSLASYIGARGTRDFVDGDRPHPSVVLYHGDEVIVGREARDQLERTDEAVIGDAVRSPKLSLLNSETIHVGGKSRTPREVIGEVIGHVIGHARKAAPKLRLDEAVVSIPVRLTGQGRRELRRAAADAGLRVRQFVHEPLAALYGWLKQQGEDTLHEYEGKLLLVFDWGGGTLDLTLCRVVGGVLVQVQNRGDTAVGGDVFDERLRRFVVRKHFADHDLEAGKAQVQPGARAKLLTRCEEAKIGLSRREDAIVFVPGYLAVEGPASDIEVSVTRQELEELNSEVLGRAMESIDLLMSSSRVSDLDIELVVALGGMSEMPAVRNRLLHRFGPERVPKVEDADRLIARGAAWIAHDDRRLRLSKPFEVRLADDSPAELIGTRVQLPVRDEQHPYRFGFHCVDPRDAFARFQLMRPIDAGEPQPTDPRLPYTTLFLPIDPAARPLAERLRLDLVIDEDLVVRASLASEQTGETESCEVHDLEFGLGLANE